MTHCDRFNRYLKKKGNINVAKKYGNQSELPSVLTKYNSYDLEYKNRFQHFAITSKSLKEMHFLAVPE